MKKWLFKIGYNVSLINVDFPLPETPVTAIVRPKGNSTLIFFKLFPLQPFNVSFFSDFLLFLGTSIESSWFKNLAVIVEDFNIFSKVPSKIMLPPFFPAFGPISIM